MPFDDKKIKEKLKKLVNLLDKVPAIVGQEAENFYKDRFHEQGWRDKNLVRWKPKKKPDGYPILRSKNPSGLADTIIWEKIDNNSILLTAGDARKPYARIHNEGGIITIPLTKRMRSYFWSMYYKSKGDERDMWKNMALSRKSQFRVIMPKRQYMGQSEALESIIINDITNHIKKIIND